MDPAVIVALIVSVAGVLFSSITAPLLISRHNDKLHRGDIERAAEIRKQERDEDWARQDKTADLLKAEQKAQADKAEQAAQDLARSQEQIAGQAAEAATLLLSAQRDSIARTDEVARVAAIQAAKAGEKLDQIGLKSDRIHTLVNSDMTVVRQEQLEATKDVVTALRKVIDLAVRMPGIEPDPRDIEALDNAERKVTELESILADRRAQMSLVEAEQVVNPIENHTDEKGGTGR